MRKIFLVAYFAWMGFATALEAPQDDSSNESIAILAFVNSNTTGWHVRGTNTPSKYLRIQFVIKDPAMTSVETSLVRFFDADKKDMGFYNSPLKTKIVGFQSVSSLTDLEPKKPYNVMYHYDSAQMDFKYVIAVMGTKEKVVVKTIPPNLDLKDFEFPEKALMPKYAASEAEKAASSGGGGGGKKKKKKKNE